MHTGHLRPQQRYCSHNCYATSPKMKRRKRAELTCEWCDREYTVLHYRKDVARFCSVDCANEWQSRNKSDHTCEICGKAFRWSPSREKAHNIRYCSVECRDQCPSRQEHLARMNAVQQLGAPTKPERIGYAILDQLEVDHIRQYVVNGKFTVDAFVPSANLVIQWDGDYWHGHPDRFPEPDKRQRKRMRLDRSQDAYMRKCGMRVARFWECDLHESPGAIQDELQRLLAAA